MIENLKLIPPWFVLFVLMVLLMIGYYIRPDNLTEDSAKAVLGALLLSIQPRQQAPPPNENPPIVP